MHGRHLTAIAIAIGASATVTVPSRADAQRYDPLAIYSPSRAGEPLDLTVRDNARSRDIPIRVYLPAASGRAPVVLFSHGLGGSRTGSKFLGEHWAARGYVAVFLQHPGSDESIWKDKPALQRMAAMREAADVRNFLLRVQDVPAVLDQLDKWNSGASPLAGRLDLAHVGMSGHSFGATTTQGVSGEVFPLGRTSYTDPRIKAAIVFSPSSGRGSRDPNQSFGSVRIPWLLMTGTKDVSPIGDQDLASRLRVFPALPPGSKYEVVLDGAEHSIFTDGRLAGESGPVNPNHHKVILALSTAFWDAYLRDDPAAKAWLNGDGPRSVMEPKDSWKKK